MSLRDRFGALNARSTHSLSPSMDLDLDPDLTPSSVSRTRDSSAFCHLAGLPEDLDLDQGPSGEGPGVPYHARHPLGPTSSFERQSDSDRGSSASSTSDPDLDPSSDPDPPYPPDASAPMVTPSACVLRVVAAARAGLVPSPGLNLFAGDPWGCHSVDLRGEEGPPGGSVDLLDQQDPSPPFHARGLVRWDCRWKSRLVWVDNCNMVSRYSDYRIKL